MILTFFAGAGPRPGKMPTKCSVFGCNSNFDKHLSEGGDKVSVYRFPKDIDKRTACSLTMLRLQM